MNSSDSREFLAAARKWWLTPVPTPIFAIRFEGSSLVAFKIAAILSFVYLSNQFLDLGARVSTLIANFDGYRGVLIFVGLWATCLAGVLAAGFLPRLWQRVVFAVPLLAGALVGTAYEDVARSEIDYDQVLMLREGVSQLGAATRFHVGSVFGAAMLTLLGAAGLLLPLRRVASVRTLLPPAIAGARLRRLRLLPAAVAALPFVALPAVMVARGGYGVGGLPVQHKVPSLLLVAEAAERLTDVDRKPVDLMFVGREPEALAAPHVVLVVDDGVRGDYLDLNVVRGTTPALLSHQDRMANFGRAVAAANCSPASNLMLRTGAMPPDLTGGAQTNPYVWSYARRAGMHTVYLHPPMDLGEMARRLSAAEREQVDELIVQRGEVALAQERHAVEVLRELVTRRDPQFIILRKPGIHYPYEIVFPQVRMPFHPPPSWEHPFRGPVPSASYDNSVTWHVDRFFDYLLSTVALDNVVLLYTSSHGQRLPGDGGGKPECSTGNTSPLEALVPMLVATDRTDWRQRFEQAAAQNLNRTSHFNLFATMLVLFGYDREQIATRFEPSLLDPIEAGHGFTTGLVTAAPRLVVGPRSSLPMHSIPREVLTRGVLSQ